jgi:4-amino-4-deoxy-L-arabinose transferase-like glycosyltransferase
MRVFPFIRDYFSRRASSPATAVLWGFLARIGAILLLHTYRFHSDHDYFAFGYETGRIARALALGQGFSNPFGGATGPTAWEAPLYPYLVGGIFRLTGIYTPLSAFLVLAVNSLFSALTAFPVYHITRRLFGEQVARWTAWVWALFPFTMYWATKLIWETSLAAFLMTTAFWLALELADARTRRSWSLWLSSGVLFGVIALTNPSCLTFLPCAWGWAAWRQWRQGKLPLLSVAASVLVSLAVIAPWEMRNYRIFHEFLPIRSNAGAELRLGNGPEAIGVWMYWLHPTQDAQEFEKYQQGGEVAYARMRGREALDFIQRNPGRTAMLCLKKSVYFWIGFPAVGKTWWQAFPKYLLYLASSMLAWWGCIRMIQRRKYGAFLFSSLLAIYPAIYYITFPHTRYRHPIEPLMLVLVVYLIFDLRSTRRGV